MRSGFRVWDVRVLRLRALDLRASRDTEDEKMVIHGRAHWHLYTYAEILRVYGLKRGVSMMRVIDFEV